MSPAIDGAARLLAIVGDPIAQARSPLVFNAILAKAGVNAVLVPAHVPAAQFMTVLQGLMQVQNLCGIVVTYPFKQQALALAQGVNERALQVGAANTLRREPDGRWTADMFDGVGLVRAVESLDQRVAGRRVKLLGAGGAGGAIAYALAAAGATEISIHDPDAPRAASLASGVARAYLACRVAASGPDLDGAGLLVNASPVGLKPADGLPASLQDLGPATTVIDIVPRTGATALLSFARDRGCPHTDAAAMVQGQAKAVLEFFGLIGDDIKEQAA